MPITKAVSDEFADRVRQWVERYRRALERLANR